MTYEIGDTVKWTEKHKILSGEVVDFQTVVVGHHPSGMTKVENAYVIEDDLGILYTKREKELLTIN